MICEKLFNKIEELMPQYCKVWEDVCNIESPTNHKEGVDRVGQYFIDMANERGWNIEIHNEDVSGNAVCITMNSCSCEAPVTFSGHIDTVHPIGLFGTPAVRICGENICGPGVMDCKGGVVASFMAMDALRLTGFTKRPVQLIIQPDEENSSVSSNKRTIDFMCEKSANSVAFLNTEGCLGDTAVLERKGILRYKFTVHGKALHSARCCEASNAITECAYKIIELEKLKNPDGLTCNCGIIEGGTSVNTVAEECSFTADIRFSTREDLERVRGYCRNIAYTSYIDGTSCEITEISFRPAMEKSDKNYELLEKINDIYQSNGMPNLMARKCLSGSDAAYITQYGIPCIDNVGVEGKNIHSIHEYARLSSLGESAKRLAAVAYCI